MFGNHGKEVFQIKVFLEIYTLPNLSTGIDDAIIDTATAVPVFIPMFLLFIFGIVFLGGFTSQKRRLGNADMPMWATIASLSTLMVSLPLTLVSEIINLTTLSIVVTITIVSGLWLFLSRNRNEI